MSSFGKTLLAILLAGGVATALGFFIFKKSPPAPPGTAPPGMPGGTAPPPPAPAPAPAPAPLVDAASVVAMTIPSPMNAGASGTFVVTVRNDGTSTWDDASRLGSVNDMAGDAARFLENPSLGYPDIGRIHLPSGTKVAPGQTWTFSFPVIAPVAQKTYDVKLEMVHENVTWFGTIAEQMVDVNGPPPLTFPTYEAMRRFRGDLSGMRIPEIKPFGATDVFFTAVYPAYPDNIRAIIRDRYKAKGYTHLPISIRLGNYHNLYPQYDFINNVAGFRVILDEIWRSGLIPVVFVIDDSIMPAQSAADMDAIKKYYTPFLQAVKDLVYIVVPGWEINGWMSPDNMTESCKWLKQTLPDALVYIHFTSGHAAGSGPTQSEADWWKSMQGVLMGILYQANGPDGADAIAARESDFTIRFQTGFHFWPTGFDTIAFEYSAYWQTNQGMSEQWGNDIGDGIFTKTSPPLQGYCDGGTLSVTGNPLPPCSWLPANPSPAPTSGSGPVTPPPPPPPPPALPALTAPSIVSNATGTTITWDEAGRGSQGFIVDIDDDGNWSNGFWNKSISSGTTTTDAPSGFQNYGGSSGPLTLTAGATYTVRVYYPATQEHSPEATFVAAATSLGPKPAPADEIDLGQAAIHNSPGDVASWPATAKITRLETHGNGFQIDFTKRDGAGSWPDYTPPGWGGPIEYTLWIVIKVNGAWHASGCIQIWRDPSMTLWSGGAPSGVAANWYYDPNRWAPMTGHQPAVGEQVGFFVTAGNARNDKSVTSVRERSNVIAVPFPSDSGATYTR